MKPDILNFKTDCLIQSFKDHHALYNFPIKDLAAENILVNFFEDNGQIVSWQPGSHIQGSDVFIMDIDSKFGYSVKSAKEPSTKQGKWLKISSYRTGSESTIEGKRLVINEIEKNTDAYVVFSRTESKKLHVIDINYFVYLIDPKILSIDSFKIESVDEKGNYMGSNDFGVKIYIKDKLSGQVWYNVPMDIIKDSQWVSKICEVGTFQIYQRSGVSLVA